MMAFKRRLAFAALPLSLTLVVLLVFLHGEPAYITKLDPTLLLLNPHNAQSGRPFLRNNLRNRAMRSLQTFDVIDLSAKDPKMLPPGASQRDYVSYNKYCWQNADGKWERRDGHINTKVTRSVPDYDSFRRMVSHVTTLALAYHFSEADYLYRERALEMVNTWFLEPNNGMLPRMEHAGICMGKNVDWNAKKAGFKSSGTRTGVLDLFPLSHIFRSLEILRLGKDDIGLQLKDGLTNWAKQYADWHQVHPFAQAESLAANNHGTAYDIQYLSLLRFIHEEPYYPTMYSEHMERLVLPRFGNSISSEGIQIYETARPASWDYSLFNLRLLHLLAYEIDSAAPDISGNLTTLWTYVPQQVPTHQSRDFVDPLEAFLVVGNATEWATQEETKPSDMPPMVRAHDFLLTHALSEGTKWPMKDIHQSFPVQTLLVMLEDLNLNLDIIRTNRYGLGRRWMKGIAQLRLLDERQRSRSTSIKNFLYSTFAESQQFIERTLIGGSSAGALLYLARWAWVSRPSKDKSSLGYKA